MSSRPPTIIREDDDGAGDLAEQLRAVATPFMVDVVLEVQGRLPKSRDGGGICEVTSVVRTAVIPPLFVKHETVTANDPRSSSKLKGVVCSLISPCCFFCAAVEVIILRSISPGGQTRDVGRLGATVGPLRLNAVHVCLYSSPSASEKSRS